jgi:hypothetical protein
VVEFQQTRVESLGELIDRTTPKERDPESGRKRSYSIFRGVSNSSWNLLTSLDRLGGITPPHTKAHLEEHILRNFIRYAHPHITRTASSEWEMLISAQHHGVPTRLLDWTYSPLIAAHFATLAESKASDRVVWQLDWRKIHEHFKLRPLAFLVSDLDQLIRERNFRNVWDFLARECSDSPFICMVEPPAIDTRIVAQAAAFTLCSNRKKPFDQYLHEHGLTHTLRKFIIPASHVSDVRDQLDLCGFDEKRLFPDLDGVATVLRRYYAATPEAEMPE